MLDKLKTRRGFGLAAQATLQVSLHAAAAAVLGCYGLAAHAQSSITLYGITDTAVRYTTHADKAGDSKVQLGNGGASESEFGMLGSEDVGGGVHAIFQLEDRFFLNSGVGDPSYPLFDIALVGLQSSTYGRLTLGRQLNPMADAVGRTYMSQNFYQFRPEVGMAQGNFTSSMTKYAAAWHDVTLELSYAFGGSPGAFGAGSQIGASLAYVPKGRLRLAAAYLDSRDAVNTSAHFKAWTAGAAYTFASTTINAGWVVNRQDQGFTGNFPNGPFTAPQLTALKFNTFSSRQMFFGGVSQQITGATLVSANVWRTLQDGKAVSGNGNATQFQLLADYSLSKRTDTYVEGDYSLYRGGLIGAQAQGFNGLSAAAESTQLGVMVGLRHRF
ncbi:porin [Paraburkholderia sp. DHOC27]|uniref:porin n=1 Tax=Paraburkholderia sp. DHOC27 TaxID=2303330 RepID=UPI000E3D7BA5|nr:porin [Paraburkholderia sp. DHOC27]RFU44787.1 porin [Paraburkholderia sp. DHOC27]